MKFLVMCLICGCVCNCCNNGHVVIEDASNPYESEWIVEDADDPFEDVWIIEDAPDPFK